MNLSKINKDLDKDDITETPPAQPTTQVSVLTNFPPATIQEIKEVVIKAPNKSCSFDPIPTSLVKSCIDELAPRLASVVNCSFQSAVFPSTFKEAIVIPLLKKPSLDCEALKNCGPVSNLNCVSKVIEKIVVRRLHDHIEENKLCSKFQSAYRPGHSKDFAHLRVHNDTIKYLDQNDNVAQILLDLSAALDTFDYDVLLKRLQDRFGVYGKSLTWFYSYLSDRVQKICISGSLSEKTELEYGVPQ